jgi:serine/threonine protein kinase
MRFEHIFLYLVFENREKMIIVMENAAGGELYDYLNERKILQEDEARRIFRQIASAVYYCHKVHRYNGFNQMEPLLIRICNVI